MAHKEDTNLTGKVMGAAKKAASYVTGEPGILAALKKEHGEVSALMKKILGTEGKIDVREDRSTLFAQLQRELLLHSHGEQKELYPKLLQHTETESLAKQSFAEHRDVEDLLDQLARMDVTEPAWMDTFHVLHDNVISHVEQEENELFPKVANLMDDDQLRDIERGYFEQKETELRAFS